MVSDELLLALRLVFTLPYELTLQEQVEKILDENHVGVRISRLGISLD